MPEIQSFQSLFGQWEEWAASAGIVLATVLVAHVVFLIVRSALKRVTRHTRSSIDDAMIRQGERPVQLILPVLAVFIVLPLVGLPATVLATVRHVLILLLIGSVSWLIHSLSRTVEDALAEKYRLDVADNLLARQVHTQIRVLRRVFVVVLMMVTLAVMLMTFPEIRQVGATLFASAGVAGLIIGMAARPALSNLIAGIQIAFTQPIRIDDVVIVENEWGRIEEISTTFVVVRIWDLRRLVLPLSYFIEHPFQNWTRVTADLLGTVFLYTDYRIPVEAVRQELRRILEASGMWDGKVCGLQVTNANERTMELRALMSSPDASIGWDLRCHVREKLIEFVQREYPESLPRIRAELDRKETGTGDPPAELR
jgi:small-conductance mechanosensitive channel